MMELYYIPLILGIGTIAGFFNTLAGGGSLLTLPLLIFLGLPPTVANGTNRVAIFVQCGNAVYAFKKKGVSNFKHALFLSLSALIGAFIGAKIAIDIDENIFNKVLAAVMIVMLGFIIFKPKNNKVPKSQDHKVSSSPVGLIFELLIFFVIGIYGGFIQAGVGFLIIATLSYFTNFNLARINAMKVFIVFIYTFIALATFILNDKVNWQIGITLAVGTALGAWIAAHFGVKKGDKWIKGVLTIAVLAFAIKLLIT